MKVKELDNILNEVLMQEAKKIITEQVTQIDHLIDSIKGFQTLSGLTNKIANIDNNGNGISINIQGVTPEELARCCDGNSLSEIQTKLMQGLHHDLEDNGMGNNFDIEIDVQGDENALNMNVQITPTNDEFSGESDMKEDKDKKEILLGSKKSCTECGKPLEEGNTTGKCDECSNELLMEKKSKKIKKAKKWIQKAVDPKHKGFCTPMTKKTCTPRRKALAMRFKKGIEKESVEKKTITLNEKQMAELIKKVIKEGVPGVDITKRVTKNAGDQNKEALKAVEKKIKDYLNFKGNDKPEFPNQIGQGAEKMARKNTKPEDEEVNINRGQSIGDAEFDYEPAKEFRKRQEEALKGSSRMGNSQDALNVIKTKTGDNLAKNIEKRKEAKEKEPLYKKEAVPVETEKKETPKREVNESVNHDIQKMKRLSSYNEKTQ